MHEHYSGLLLVIDCNIKLLLSIYLNHLRNLLRIRVDQYLYEAMPENNLGQLLEINCNIQLLPSIFLIHIMHFLRIRVD